MRKRTTTKRKTSRTAKYKSTTGRHLATLVKKWQKKLVSWTYTKGTTVAQRRRAIQQEIKKVAQYLRVKTVAKINARIKTLKTQIAKRLDVAITSPKVTSSAIQRLTIKCRQIGSCANPRKLVSLCKGLKLTSYKNPKYAKKKATKKTSYKRVSYTKKSTTKKSTTKKTGSFKKQTATLKKEIRVLKQRNTYMQQQVAKFRKDATQMQRHYGSLSNKTPYLRVVEQDVSNIVRFSNALNAAVSKQRKAG